MWREKLNSLFRGITLMICGLTALQAPGQNDSWVGLHQNRSITLFGVVPYADARHNACDLSESRHHN
jgi:hypothetical protein